MPASAPFWIALVATVLLIVGSLVTGFTRRRRLHLWLGPLTVVALVVAIVLTEQLMSHYTFPPDRLRIHLWFAKAGGVLVLPVVATGVWLWRAPRARVWHRGAVIVWLVSVLAATGTGLWMFAEATLKTS